MLSHPSILSFSAHSRLETLRKSSARIPRSGKSADKAASDGASQRDKIRAQPGCAPLWLRRHPALSSR